MNHNLVIRGGTVVDGTGAEPYTADVAIDGDTITEIGRVDGNGAQEIDADGLHVSPGFIDLHTHMDAQIGWDKELTSISWHGVTTALLGNCGVTFAPCRETDREFLAAMMETVEDIPKEAILHGLPWNWTSYGGYLDALETLGPAINVAGLVGHCATRFYVMGERAVEEIATPDEIRQIAMLAGQSVREGAFGFSTSRLPGHQLPDGRPIPGTFAPREELLAVAKEVGKGGGFMQRVSMFLITDFDAEMDLIADEARLCRGALFSCGVEIGIEQMNARVKAMRAEGLNVTGLTLPRSTGNLSGLSNNSFFRTDAWNELRDLDFDARVKAIRDPRMRNKLVDEVKSQRNVSDADLALQGDVVEGMKHWFYVGDQARPCYTRPLDQSLTDLAAAAGEHPVETWLRITDQTDGKALFHMRAFNIDLDELSKFISADWVMPGLGDAGAHVTQMIDSGWPTFFLSHWHRDTGLFSIQEAVRRLTAGPAAVLGLGDRGTLAVGKRADVNVFDIGGLTERMPEIVHDFPFGAPRFIQRAAGYKATVCNGEVILRDDELTGTGAGRVLRSNTGMGSE